MFKKTENKPIKSIKIIQPQLKQSFYQQNKDSPLQINSNNLLNSDRSFQPMTIKTMQSQAVQSRMKLKDYLFLAKTSAKKMAQQKRKLLASRSCDNLQNDWSSIDEKIRKNKYSMKNSEMLRILQDQMQKDLQNNIKQIEKLKKRMQQYIKNNPVPTNSDMVMMYNLRGIIKKQLAGSIKMMNDLYSIAQTTQRDIPMQVDIIMTQQQIRTDIEGTTRRFSQKYDIQMQKRNQKQYK